MAGKLIKPLNLDYIPNLQKNIWPELVSPFYDVDSHYTVPYTCYATGIAWRTDKVTEDIAAMPQPWDIFWQARGVQGQGRPPTEQRETIAMALLRKGHTGHQHGGSEARQSGGRRPEGALRHLQHQGRRHPVLGESRGHELAAPGVVGRHDRRLHLLPAEGDAADRPRLLEGGQGQGAGAERLLVDLRDDEEARALAPVAELHPRQRRRVHELRRLQRLPATAERDRSGLAHLRRRRAGAPR